MAAIDFPASPTVGQAFTAGNGVVYTWNGTLWLASGASAGGDVTAYGATASLAAGSDVAVVFPTVQSGNANGWLNVSNGRYTPAAGSYFIQSTITFTSPPAGNGSATLALRKNGVRLPSAVASISGPSGNFAIPLTVGEVVVANGTDYFDVVANVTANVALGGAPTGLFTAFPISGIKGPPGDPGQLGFRLLQRTVVSSAVADVSIQNIPSDINDVMVHFDLVPTTSDAPLMAMMFDGSGTLITGSGTYLSSLTLVANTVAIGAAVQSSSSTAAGNDTAIICTFAQAGQGVNNDATIGGMRGRFSSYNIRNTTRTKAINFDAAYLNHANNAYFAITGAGNTVFPSAVTGFRLLFLGSNIASGAFSVWGSP